MTLARRQVTPSANSARLKVDSLDPLAIARAVERPRYASDIRTILKIIRLLQSLPERAEYFCAFIFDAAVFFDRALMGILARVIHFVGIWDKRRN
jgi:hypothetical protein